MIDYANIKVKAGDGGEGAGSFVHIKGKRRGKADGGDGGAGGNVYFVATANLKGLESFRFIKDYSAQNGQRGLSNKRKGAQGADLEIKVPVGTQIAVKSVSLYVSRVGNVSVSVESVSTDNTENTDFADGTDYTDYADSTDSTRYDLMESEQRILIARGGEGGRGNCHLRDEYGRRPRSGEKGTGGEQLEAKLELKLIADVGLVGMPNAGKSTLIAALTSARPKIADYPFTTLEPNLGVLSVDHSQSTIDQPTKLVIADIPGLIEGASEGKGLGDLFLRHIERTKILVHLVDVSAEADLWQNYQTIRNELKVYSKDLANKKEIIVLSKIDLVDKEASSEAIGVFAQHRKNVIAISAQEKKGLDLLLQEISINV